MLFNSIEFAVFLSVFFILYWFVFKRVKTQNVLIVAASFVFYGIWDWKLTWLLLGVSLITWLSGWIYARLPRRYAKYVSIANIVVCLGTLVLFKYYDFFAQSFADMFLAGSSDGILLNLIVPVGLSFYLFKSMSYSIDVCSGRMEYVRNPVIVAAYISFFPQLLCGPIERPSSLIPQLLSPRYFEYSRAVNGMRQMLWGLFKKVVIADNCAIYVNHVWVDIASQNGSTLVLAAILYSIQIYCDFSGYSDIAIGVGRLLGFDTRKNFSVPYFSRNIAEFWRRWHISLTSWFRDYVYIPLGGSREGLLKTVVNTLIVFSLSGLWHGANWTFIVWGLFNGILLIPLILSGANRRYRDVAAEAGVLPSFTELWHILITFALVTAGWIFFRADSVGQAVEFFSGIISRSILSVPYLITRSFYIPLFLSILLLTVVEWLGRREDNPFSLKGIDKGWVRLCIYWFFVILVFHYIGEKQSFIYFQF